MRAGIAKRKKYRNREFAPVTPTPDQHIPLAREGTVAAVLALIQARHEISKPVLAKRARKLIKLDILEEVKSKGTTEFRLSIKATEKLNVQKTKPTQNSVLP